MTTCYNPEKRIFFVHIPKCAGTSIGGRFDGISWKHAWLNEAVGGFVRDGLPNGHQPVFKIPKCTGKPIEWWRKIIVTIRNPYEQQLSQWTFWRERAKAQMGLARKLHRDDQFVLEPGMTFERFLEDPRSNGPNACCGSAWREVGGVYRWWCQVGGVVPPNVHVIRTEDLPGALYEALEVDDPPPLPVKNSTDHDDWESVYTDRMRCVVREKFAWSMTTKYADLK